MVNLGIVYPQALLIWTLGVTYSIISPLILPFATLYFGVAYLVYKYKFLFVYCEHTRSSERELELTLRSRPPV